MKKTIQSAFLATAYVLCALAAWNSSEDLIGTEFSGGRVTGPMLDGSLIAALAFVLAVITTFISRRIASMLALLAIAISLPLYLFRVFPRIFVQVVGGEWANPPTEVFVWHPWPVTGLLASTLVASVCWRLALPARTKTGTA